MWHGHIPPIAVFCVMFPSDAPDKTFVHSLFPHSAINVVRLDMSYAMTPETNRILIAEDHYVSRHLLERNLSNWGFEVMTAEDGEAAVRVLESAEAPPLAIIDWMMPKLDGLEVCRRIREKKDRPYIYLVLLTAKS